MSLENVIILCLFIEFVNTLKHECLKMLAINKNKLLRRVSKSILKIRYESCFWLDAKETFLHQHTKDLLEEKNI